MLMKGLKLTGLGVGIWGLSLSWPDVNLMLAPSVIIGMLLGLGVAVLLAYVLLQRLDQRHDHEETGQDQPSSDSSTSGSIAVLNTA
jgi:uncharacterized protein involved in exopolysaccharide biosynthesis